MTRMAKELTAGQKAARTRKLRAAGKKAALTKKRRNAGRKAAATRRARANGSPPREVSPDRIMQLGLGFWGSKAVLSAVELGLFTELAGGPLDAEALRQRLNLHPRSVHDFLDALVALGMLARKGREYANTPESDLFLDRAQPSYVGGLLEMANARLYGFWGSLTEALRTGRPQKRRRVAATRSTRSTPTIRGCASFLPA